MRRREPRRNLARFVGGVAMFLSGQASGFYPPLKLLISSMTTSVAICTGGLALMNCPTLTVGN